MSDITVLISTKPLESTFYDVLMDNLDNNLSEFIKSQFNLIIQKHCAQYCLFVGLEVCNYQKGDIEKNPSLDFQTDQVETEFKKDLFVFFNRFMNWEYEFISDFIEGLQNILRNIFIQQLLAVTGMDLYDHRQFKLRTFEYSREYSAPGERVLFIVFERNTFFTTGCKLVI